MSDQGPLIDPNTPLARALGVQQPSGAAPSTFSLPDYLMVATGVLTAEPLCHAGWDAVVSGEHIDRGVIAIIAGLVVGTAQGTFHWWKTHVNAKIKRNVERNAGWFVGFAAFLLFCFLVGPNIYNRITTTPTPQAIAKAVVREMSANSMPPSQTEAPSGQIVKNISIGVDPIADVDNRWIIQCSFTTIASGPRIRVFVEYEKFWGYQMTNDKIKRVSIKRRIQLYDLKDYYKEDNITLTILRRHRYVDNVGAQAWSFNFGGEDIPATEETKFETTQEYKTRLVMSSDDGIEQYYEFYIIQEDNRRAGSTFKIITQDEWQRLTEWH